MFGKLKEIKIQYFTICTKEIYERSQQYKYQVKNESEIRSSIHRNKHLQLEYVE